MRYAFTSGIPDPAAAGAMKAQRAAAAVANPKLQPVYAKKALKYLRWNHNHVTVIFRADYKPFFIEISLAKTYTMSKCSIVRQQLIF